MKYQQCSRCVMDNASDKKILFDSEGVCNYCTEAISRMKNEYFPNEAGQKILDKIMKDIKEKGKGKEYDCIVGISGGLDSSMVLMMGCNYGLRMLGVHLDDGLDTECAKSNIQKLLEKTGTECVFIKPNPTQYVDVLRSFFLAGVPGVAIPQDNLIISELEKAAKSIGIKYNLSGGNFALESILERGVVNAADKRHIIAIHNSFGREKIDQLNFISIMEKYVAYKYLSPVKNIRPLNYIEYNLDHTIHQLDEFCGFEYYGGKHHESVLTRFLQGYYLPQKFGIDKRKSHLSSLIITNQITREQALFELSQNPVEKYEELENDICVLANMMRLSDEEFKSIITSPPHSHDEYKMSLLNSFAPAARRIRRYLG